MNLKKNIKAQLSKIKFAAGLNPKIQKPDNPALFIPSKFKGVCTITADFELAWAPRYSHRFEDAYTAALEYARRERKNVPKLLAICETYSIPITWATVGHLFLNECSATNGRPHPEIPPVPAYKGKYWSFAGDNWFEYDPCTNLEQDPEWYAPDLIHEILDCKTNQEIGCHTFSHIDCRDTVCPPALFKAELNECKKLAAAAGLTLKTFVHPGHTIGNLNHLKSLGFDSYQTDPGNILGYPIRRNDGLWELQRTMEFTYRPEWSIQYHIRRYITIIKRAIRQGLYCNFWFHPSFPTIIVKEILPSIFAFLDKNRDSIWTCTVGEYTDFLNEQGG